MKLRLSPPHCDWSACLHQHFFCTFNFNPTRPFFMLSNRPPSGYCVTPSKQLTAVSFAPFSTSDLLGTTDSCLSLHNDIPATTSQKLQPALPTGPLAPSVIDRKPFPGKRRKLLSNLLGPVLMALQRSPHVLGVRESMGYAKTLKHFRAGFSVHIQFWCLGTGTHADAQGQKAPFPLGMGASLTLMPSKGQP